MSESSTYPLRLPRSVKAAVEKLAREEGISMNQFVATAVAEKLAVMSTAAFFAERKGRADLKAFGRLLNRKGGQTPRSGDFFQSCSWHRAAAKRGTAAHRPIAGSQQHDSRGMRITERLRLNDPCRAGFAETAPKGGGDEIAALPGMLARPQAARAPASARSKTARADAWSAAAPRMTAACEITASRIAFGSARAASASTSSSCSARAAARVAA